MEKHIESNSTYKEFAQFLTIQEMDLVIDYRESQYKNETMFMLKGGQKITLGAA